MSELHDIAEAVKAKNRHSRRPSVSTSSQPMVGASRSMWWSEMGTLMASEKPLVKFSRVDNR